MIEDLLNINASEQIRKFLIDDTTFIDSNFIDTVVFVLFSKINGTDEKIKNALKDNLLAFSVLCNKYNNLQKEYGIDSNLDIVDKNVINSVVEMSTDILNNNSDNITQKLFEKYRELMNTPVSKLTLETDQDLLEKYKKYQIPNQIKIEDCQNLQKIIDNKNNTIDIITQIKTFTNFMTDKANNCNSLTDFAKGFIDTLDTISTNITATSSLTDESLNLTDVLEDEGFASILHTNDNKVQCGISMLDALMGGGFDRGRIYMFGGQTGGGKSTVLLNILYGMLKICNGICFNENDLYSEDINSTIKLINKFSEESLKYNKGKKKLFLYYTLENTKEETVKRLLCRMGLLPGTYWLLLERDKNLAKAIKEKGKNLTIDDLPSYMSNELKLRIVNFHKLISAICNKNQLGSIEIIWKAPYSITAYDILMDCKKYKRRQIDVEAIFVDYPDKMRATTTTKNNRDQEWLELGKIIDNLKALAAQVNVPVLAVTQINREANKDANVSKLGATSGSIQKEYNTDTQINMNFNNNDTSMEEYYKQFSEQQKRSNIERERTFKDLLKGKTNIDNINAYKFYNDISTATARSSDVIRMKTGVPLIQTVNCYITKNRDSVAKMAFNLYIAYGMYLVSDFEAEVYKSSRYSVETYMLIANHLLKNGLISPETFRVAVESEANFIDKFNQTYSDISGKMKSLSDSIVTVSNPFNNTNLIQNNNVQNTITKLPSNPFNNTNLIQSINNNKVHQNLINAVEQQSEVNIQDNCVKIDDLDEDLNFY